MVRDPLVQYELCKARQRDLWREAERDRYIRAATANQPGKTQMLEVAPDLTGLVARILQRVWGQLGLPAREGETSALPVPSSGLPLPS